MVSFGEVYDFDRYRRLLSEANDEPKRLALINLLIEEKARDRLAEQMLHDRLASMGLKDGATAQPTTTLSTRAEGNGIRGSIEST
jgi:hypothetical protein